MITSNQEQIETIIEMLCDGTSPFWKSTIARFLNKVTEASLVRSRGLLDDAGDSWEPKTDGSNRMIRSGRLLISFTAGASEQSLVFFQREISIASLVPYAAKVCELYPVFTDNVDHWMTEAVHEQLLDYLRGRYA